MQATNIRTLQRGDDRGSCYRLLSEPVSLKIRTAHLMDVDECRWEDDGGPSVELAHEETTEEHSKRMIKVRGARKQGAARMVRPRESVKVINMSKPAIPEVVDVRLAGGSADDERVASLQARIKSLLGLVDKMSSTRVK